MSDGDDEGAPAEDTPVETGGDPGHAGDAGAGDAGIPEASLQIHVFHLASQVGMALGETENPLTGKREKDLRTARFLIDVIAMLEDKTRGNRTTEEDEYLTGVLTNLRMAYVSKSSG